MKIMLDANVLISAILFPNSIIGCTVEHIKKFHTIVLCQYILDEIEFGFKNKKKLTDKLQNVTDYISLLPFELYRLDALDFQKYPYIRDKKDLPILANAIESGVDILITGDADFDSVEIDKPRIMKPRQFQDEFMKEK